MSDKLRFLSELDSITLQAVEVTTIYFGPLSSLTSQCIDRATAVVSG